MVVVLPICRSTVVSAFTFALGFHRCGNIHGMEERRDADKNRCMRSLLPHFSEDIEMVLKHASMVTYLTSVRAVGVGGYITAIVSES